MSRQQQHQSSIAYLSTAVAAESRSFLGSMDRSKQHSIAALAQQQCQHRATQGPACDGGRAQLHPANSDTDCQQRGAGPVSPGSGGSTAGPRGEETRAKRAKRRKRKTVRACNHCQRSHLTCDESRPCTRCVKRGMGETCVDGARKRAKYLLDAGEQANHAMVEEPAEASVAGPIEASIPAPLHEQPLSQPHQQRQQQQYRQQQQLQTMAQMSALSPPLSSPTFASTSGSRSLAAPVPSADLGVVSPAPLGVTGLHTTPSAANFGSEAINLEYMFLSSMLAYPQFAPSALPPAMEGTAVDAASGMQGQCPAIGPGVVASIPSALWATQPTVPLPPLLSPPQHNPAALISPPPVNDAQAAVDRGAFDGGLALGRQHYEQWPPRSMVRDRTAQTANGTQPHGSAPQKTAAAQPSPPPHAQIVSDDTHHPLSRPPTTGPAVYGLNPVYPQSPAEVYSSVTEPYKYYNGFHFFFRHISGRMDKKDIMRVSRAIAHFRPSLVAQLRNLTRDDLIFMEKSFQRALMEYEKLIVFIGTPTVVWRRSGEIALVGKEFSILTQWDRQLLMSGNKFIFELMDTKSAVVYWEQFAVHAFENSEHSVMSECRLVRPDGVAVPCAFSFTIKRDLFGIPMAIIGNFLPIL